MNAKAERQIEEMKKQTIGVEVEMNNITRNKAAKLATYFEGSVKDIPDCYDDCRVTDFAVSNDGDFLFRIEK